jgi:hypothetical protein
LVIVMPSVARRRPFVVPQDLIDVGIAGLGGFDTKQHLVSGQPAHRDVHHRRAFLAELHERLEPPARLRVRQDRRRSLSGEVAGAEQSSRSAADGCGSSGFQKTATRQARRRSRHTPS